MKKKILPLLPLLHPAVVKFYPDYDYKKSSLNYLEEGIDYLALRQNSVKEYSLLSKVDTLALTSQRKYFLLRIREVP